MIDGKRLLDALVGAVSQAKPGGGGPGQPQGGFGDLLQQVLGSSGSGSSPTPGTQPGQRSMQPPGGSSGIPVDQYVEKAKAFMDKNPGLAQAALMGVAGVLFSKRRSRGIGSSLAGLGGLALIGGLAYKAFQLAQSGTSASASGTSAVPKIPASGTQAGPAAFDPAAATDDDAMRFIRAMVAAATADGHMDDAERARVLQGLSQAGIDPEATRWLERELTDPADVEELAEGINTPEKGAQVYAAARLAIEPDTIQEREFLRQLAAALDLDAALVRQIDDAATGIKVAG